MNTKGGKQQFGLSRDVLGFASGFTLFALVKLQRMLQTPCIFGPFDVLPYGQANSRSMTRPLARLLMAAFPSTPEPSCFHFHPVQQQGSVWQNALNVKCNPNSKHL